MRPRSRGAGTSPAGTSDSSMGTISTSPCRYMDVTVARPGKPCGQPIEQFRRHRVLGVPEPRLDPELLRFAGGGEERLGVLHRYVVVGVTVHDQQRHGG